MPSRAARVHHQSARRRTSPTSRRSGKVGDYHVAYGDNIHIIGVTLSKNIGGVSVGAEVSYRQNMPLLSDPVQVLPTPLVQRRCRVRSRSTACRPTARPARSATRGTASSTRCEHLPKTPLFDTATFAAELTWMHWAKVTQNEAVFKGRDSYTADRQAVARLLRPRDQLHADLVPGVSGRRPARADHLESQGIRGNAAVFLGGNEGGGNYARRHRRRHLLRSTGSISSTPATTATTRPTRPRRRRRTGVPTASFGSLSDRGWVSLTFKTTF